MRASLPSSAGFSTVEMLIAAGIFLIAMTAAFAASFGDQDSLGQSRAYENALAQAQTLMLQEEMRAQEDFRLLNDVATTSESGENVSATVRDFAGDPYTTKHVEADASWLERGVTRTVSLNELLADYLDPATLDTCDNALSGNWKTPVIANHSFVAGDLLPLSVPLGHSFSAANPVAALDAYHGVLYLADATTSGKTNDSFFAFDISRATAPRYLGSIDTNPASIDGASAVVAAGTYAYLANAHAADFKSCKSGSASCAQLQIINVANPASLSAPINYELPTSTAPFVTGSSGQAVGKSIAYSHGLLYVGLAKTGTGPEFNIIDASNPASPKWLGGYAVGAGVAAISVRGSYAYLATDRKANELLVLDVANPASPSLVGTYDVTSPAGWGDGESLYQLGRSLFLGLTYATVSPEVYELDISQPAHPAMLSAYIASSSVIAVFVRDSVLFALTSTAGTAGQLQILDASDTARIVPYAHSVPLPGSGYALDCEENYFYAGSGSAVSVIGPGS